MRRYAAPITVAALVLLVVIGQLPAVQGQLQALGVLPRQTTYQSLYFVEPDALPRSLSEGPTILRPTVEIANYAPDSKDLTWTLSVIGMGGQETIMSAKSVTVARFSRADISPQVTTNCYKPRIYIKYLLQETGQHIGFWVDCT